MGMEGASMSVPDLARRVYDLRLKLDLEANHHGRYVAIEPISGDFFLADKFIDAALAAKHAYPDRKSFVIRVGFDAAFHLGSCAS
jgi:hypothetical protein